MKQLCRNLTGKQIVRKIRLRSLFCSVFYALILILPAAAGAYAGL